MMAPMRWMAARLCSSVLAVACGACEHGSGAHYARDEPGATGVDGGNGARDAGAEADGAEPAPNPCAEFDSALGRSGDADGDGVEDWVEGYLGSVATAPDTDRDGTPDFCDLDADDDCRPDALEGTADPEGDFLGAYVDRDSDGDGVLDALEDADCDGELDARETNPFEMDSDHDGASDLVEQLRSTDARNAADHPAARGELVFLMAPDAAARPARARASFGTRVRWVDVYLLLDRSASMAGENEALRSNIAGVASALRCPPAGTGDPASCIPDLWFGVGAVGFAGSSGGEAYRHLLDLQPNPDVATLALSEPAGCCSEPTLFGLYAALSGQGTASVASCGIGSVAARGSCDASPAGAQGHGYPCFRPGALPIVALVTDDAPRVGSSTTHCPDWEELVKPRFQAASARLIGIRGSGATDEVWTDLGNMAIETRSLGANAVALVLDGANASAPTALRQGVGALASALTLDLSARLLDDPSDDVDAVTSFVERVEVVNEDMPGCQGELSSRDTDGDGWADTFLHVRSGAQVCWNVVLKPNTSVAAGTEPAVYTASWLAVGDGQLALEGAPNTLYFIVPPRSPDASAP
jgi:hypothetical protein